jgi:hypothetical protein
MVKISETRPAEKGGRPPKPKLTFEQRVAIVANWLRLFVKPGQVTELVAVGVRQDGRGRPHQESGFYDHDHLDDMARDALTVTDCAKGVYFVANPIKTELLARRANRLDWAAEGELAKDKDTLRRRWLLVDLDPVRDALISATDSEKAKAWELLGDVRDYLAGEGWELPIVADSGNGYHLLYRIDLPAEDGGIVKGILATLAAKFDTDAVKIDQAVHNPARLIKVPGTWARKGDSIPDRPHRRGKLLEVPSNE